MGGNSADGADVEAEYIQVFYFLEFSSKILENRSKPATKSARKGEDGSNFENIERPVQPNPIHHKDIVKQYVDYVASKMANNVQKTILNEFMNELKKDLVVSAVKTVKNWNTKEFWSRKKEGNGHSSKHEMPLQNCLPFF